MALNLSKGKPAINLTKSVPNNTKYTVGLSWDGESDLDASVVVMKNGSRKELVYFDNLTTKGITHQGDALDGAAEGDDETIDLDLAQVEGDELIVTITSYNSGTFGTAEAPVATLYANGNVLLEAPLDSECAFGTALELVKFTVSDGDWSFENLSNTLGSSANGLEDVVAKYS